MKFQPAPPARRATDPELLGVGCLIISTRAPRTEGDRLATDDQIGFLHISTRAPRTEGDHLLVSLFYS